MCRPRHFAVSYRINPWMDPNSWALDGRALASSSRREWARLHQCLVDCGARIELVSPVRDVPDLVFTANAAVVLDGKALLSRFRYPQRRLEEAHFAAAFQKLRRRGVIDIVETLPQGLVLEGAGDCVWDGVRKLFWMGYGPRSDFSACNSVAGVFGAEVVALELADARFYHMDTALRPLPRGEVMYVPGAFTRKGRAVIERLVKPVDRIALAMDDALSLSANAVCVDTTIVVSGCSVGLRKTLEARGYRVLSVPLRSFLHSGGSAFCLTLRLDLRSGDLATTRPSIAA
ncbi:MAG: amidinotransferase [Proteobacteria bacterium]|nr:amidinotransferase [Pseudomonadota bacterium]